MKRTDMIREYIRVHSHPRFRELLVAFAAADKSEQDTILESWRAQQITDLTARRDTFASEVAKFDTAISDLEKGIEADG